MNYNTEVVKEWYVQRDRLAGGVGGGDAGSGMGNSLTDDEITNTRPAK